MGIKTCVLAIDLQLAEITPIWYDKKEGFRDVLPVINRLLDVAHTTHTLVIHYLTLAEENLKSDVIRMPNAATETGENIEIGVEGRRIKMSESRKWHEGHTLIPEIHRYPVDFFNVKNERNSFDASDGALANWLKSRDIQRVVSIGFNGDDCVPRTAIGAQNCGFNSYVAVDCTNRYIDNSYLVARVTSERVIGMLEGTTD